MPETVVEVQWFVDWLEGRLKFEDLTLNQRKALAEFYAGKGSGEPVDPDT
jgi:hypothetical protein